MRTVMNKRIRVHKYFFLLTISILVVSLLLASCWGDGGEREEGATTPGEIEAVPLNISSPPFSEVNKPISFLVTSEGMPVEDATVCFAGYERRTDASGTASFQIDFPGSFKGIAEKEGYAPSSTILWVFPEGNEDLPIRAIRTMPGYDDMGLSTYRMAGVNFVSMKVYYQFDDEFNLHPLILGEDKFIVSREIQEQVLKWAISRFKAWGFKVYLQAQSPIPSKRYTFKRGDVSKDKYMEQIKEQALWLAEFAEGQGIDLLDPFGRCEYFSLEEMSVYKELLPELRERFSGKLVGGHLGLGGMEYKDFGCEFPEFDYSGFDYITPRFEVGLYSDSPLEVRNRIKECLQFAEYLKEKYGVGILPIWLANFCVYEEYEYKKFYDEFISLEDARVWLLDAIFDELSRREVEGVSAYDIHYRVRPSLHGGPEWEPQWQWQEELHSWQSKRKFNVVSTNFCQEWDEDVTSALSMLRHTQMSVNSIVATSPDSATELEQAWQAFRNGDCPLVNTITREILSDAYAYSDNPLGITVDGDPSEWHHLDPVYFNPSQISPWLLRSVPELYPESAKTPYGPQPPSLSFEERLPTMGNLKAIYAINDPEYLYLMLEFYGPAPSFPPYIDIDASGEWTHEDGKEFFLVFSPHVVIAHNRTKNSRLEGTKLADLHDFAYGDVIELKIPLEIIQSPNRVNLMVWYQDIRPWGDVEISIIDWASQD